MDTSTPAPAAAAARPATAREGAGARAVMLAMACLIVWTRLSGLAHAPEPWLDEAMQLLNFLNMGGASLFAPQPYFEQATSLGYLALGRLAAEIAPHHLAFVLRAAAAAASLAGAGLLWLALRRARPPLEAALAAGLPFLAPVAVLQSLEIKAYVFEALATAAVMAAAAFAEGAERQGRALAWLLAATLAALVFANAAVFPIAGFGAALFLSEATRRPLEPRRLAAIAVAGAAIVAAAGALYLAYTRPAVAVQLEAYADVFARGDLATPFVDHGWVASWIGFLNLLEEPFELDDFKLERLLTHVAFALGLVSTLTSRNGPTRFLGLGGALTLAALALAAMSSVFTPHRARHVLFLVPIVGFFLAAGLCAAVRFAGRLAPPSVRPAVGTTLSAAVAALILGYGVHHATARPPVREPLAPVAARLAATPGWAARTWVYYGAQPQLDLATWPRPVAYLGRVSHRTSRTSWAWSIRRDYDAYLARFRRETAGLDTLYIVLGHVHETEGERLLAAAREKIGPCRALTPDADAPGASALYLCRAPA